MFEYCSSLRRLDLSKFDMSNVTEEKDMFYGCSKLNYIKCTKAFKEWCLSNASYIGLSTTPMWYGGTGTWDIVN